jgi:periplasmic protein TonB
MRAYNMPFGIPRHDAMRWSFCFAVVIATHGAAALALWLNPSSDSDFDAGAPVVMIELPEVPAAFTTPPSDIAPGPTEPESEQTAPEEKTKPPEQVAEVTLPEPEPPKPEPPAEEKPPTAMPSVVMAPPAPPVAGAAVQPSPALVHRWESELVAHIERFKRYPAEARARGDQGLARVAFTVDRDGSVRESRIVQGSGSRELDHEALALLTRAQPVPRPPDRISSRELSFVVPIRFNIR